MANETNMIAACPRCRARYRIEARRLQPEGLRLRCSSCNAVFRVTPPPAAAAPAEPPRPVAEPRQPEPAPEPIPQPVAVAPSAPAAPAREPKPHKATSSVVLLADSDVDAGKRMAHSLSDWGYTPVLVHDGVEAILTIQRLMPPAVVLDAGLPKMFGFQICELMKRNESLRSIQVVLVGAIHDQSRYRREPNELYGADAYIERPQLPEALRAVLRGFGIGPDVEPQPPTPSPEPVREVLERVPPPPVREAEPLDVLSPRPEPTPRAWEPDLEPEREPLDVFSRAPEPTPRSWEPGPELEPEPELELDPEPELEPEPELDLEPEPLEEFPPTVDPGPPALELDPLPPAPRPVAPAESRPAPAESPAAPVAPAVTEASPEHEAAERLARIIVSDILLYNAEKFDAGLASGDVVGALSAELGEGRTLFAQRVPAAVREQRDFLSEELLRVARSRGGTG